MDYEYILDRVPVRKTFGQYTKLTADGSFWLGDCPICKEDDKNFLVSTTKKLFYCFSCQDHGNVIDFVAKCESITLKEASQQLINTWGIHEPGKTGGLLNQLAKKLGPVLKKLAKT